LRPALSERLDALEERVVALEAKKSKSSTSEKLAEQQILLSSPHGVRRSQRPYINHPVT
jgi:hypothetical protein